MTKQISVSLNDMTFDRITKPEITNRSQYVEQLINMGLELEMSDWNATKSKIIELNQEIRIKNQEIAKLKVQIGKLESKKPKKWKPSQELEIKHRMGESLKRSGILEGSEHNYGQE